MTQASSKSNLTPAKQSLLGLMQRLNFGCIQGFAVRDGEPVLEPKPRIVREVKFGGENGPRPETAKQDFPLRKEVRDLFAQMESLGDGTVLSLEVKHGLPFKMSFEEDAA